MNKTCTVLLPGALLLLCSMLLPATVFADNWSHIEQSDGVDVYERTSRYHGDNALRGVIEVDMPIDKVVSVFVDADERLNWVYRVAEQEVLGVDDDQQEAWEERYWTRVDMPFPVSDRDYVLHAAYQFHRDQRKVTAILRSTTDPRMPEQDCCVRAESVTRYTIEALPGEERTRIEVIIETDLNGSVPRRLIDRAGPDWPAGTLSGLVERAKANGIAGDERVANWHDE